VRSDASPHRQICDRFPNRHTAPRLGTRGADRRLDCGRVPHAGFQGWVARRDSRRSSERGQPGSPPPCQGVGGA
jgi:hypothetical protein